MTTDLSNVEKVEESKDPQMSIVIAVTKDGSIEIVPYNVTNKLELIGLLDFANQKKIELLQSISGSPEIRTMESLASLIKLASSDAPTPKE